MKKAIITMTASLIIMACGHLDCNAQARNHAAATTKTTATASCWKMSQEAMPGLQVNVTAQGGAEVVWTNWNSFMNTLMGSMGMDNYPFDAPMNREDILGLQSKVKGLAVMGNPIAPFVYFLLEDNSVQLFSIYKLCTTWNFHAGKIVGRNIASIQEKVKNHSYTVLIDKNGKKITEDKWATGMQDLWGYSIDAYRTLVEHLVIDVDGSMTYTYSTGLNTGVYRVYHGIVTNYRHNMKSLLNTYEYQLTSVVEPNNTSNEVPANITGRFTVKPERKLDGYFRIVPTKGLNMAAFDSSELGEIRNMLLYHLVEDTFSH